MKPYRDILVATDFSECSEAAIGRAIDLARSHNSRLSLVNVVEHFPEDIPVDWVAPEDVDPKVFLADAARKKLADLVKRFECTDAEQHVVLSSGSAKHEIIKFAQDRKVDLIVVGAHSRRGILKLIGSTAMGVVQGAQCDVLMVYEK